MSAERQKQVLAGLVAVLAVVAWRYLGAGPVVIPRTAGVAERAVPRDVPPLPADVALDALESGRGGPADGGRNPFVFGVRQVVVHDGGDRRPITRRPEAAAVTPPPAPPGPPPLPPIPFKFIGVVEGTAGARRIAVLSDSKGIVAHGSEGTIIDGRFRILAIGAESLDIAYADGRGRQTLRLTGQ